MDAARKIQLLATTSMSPVRDFRVVDIAPQESASDE
jgi:hypothetical protein